jgi:Protein of unknown function (DUF2958)
MELLTEELRTKIPALYATDAEEDPMVWAKFFTPWANWAWYVIEGQPKDDDFLFLGWVVEKEERELGYFLLSELDSVEGPFGLKIERDDEFKPCRLSEVKKQHRDTTAPPDDASEQRS